MRRTLPSHGRGRWFKSSRAHHFPLLLGHFHWPLSALNLSCAENVPIIFGHSNYMDIDSLERVGNLPENEILRRLATTRKILQKAGAHYVIDPINIRLKDDESPCNRQVGSREPAAEIG